MPFSPRHDIPQIRAGLTDEEALRIEQRLARLGWLDPSAEGPYWGRTGVDGVAMWTPGSQGYHALSRILREADEHGLSWQEALQAIEHRYRVVNDPLPVLPGAESAAEPPSEAAPTPLPTTPSTPTPSGPSPIPPAPIPQEQATGPATGTGAAPPTGYPGGSVLPSTSNETPAQHRAGGILGDPATFTHGAPYGAPYASFYTDQDVYTPFSLSPQGIVQIQSALQQAGWLGDFRPGIWDVTSQDAFRDLLTYANQAGVPWQEALQQSIDAQAAGAAFGIGGGSSGGSAGQVLTIQLPDPQDVQRSVEQLSRDLTNVDLGQGFYQHISDQYIDMLRNVQLQQADQLRAATGNANLEQTDPESLETFATNAIEEQRPGQVRRARVGSALGAFEDLIAQGTGL